MATLHTDPLIGTRLSHYRLCAQVGSGAMGTVYRAHDERLRRDVAVKVLGGCRTDGGLCTSLVNEAQMLSRLNHPNIAAVYDMGVLDGREFVVLEFVPGCTLQEMLVGGPLAPREVARLGAQMARGLAAAHAEGVIHRDVKPANIKVTPAGDLKLLDFGVARLAGETRAQRSATDDFTGPVGTVPFMSPEQVRCETLDERSDIFSAGGVLFYMATGRPAFPQPQLGCLIDALLHLDPIRPSVINPNIPPALEAVLLRALRKRPEDRYQSAAQLAAALNATAEQLARTREYTWRAIWPSTWRAWNLVNPLRRQPMGRRVGAVSNRSANAS
ncbi:MAG TPA: serine/threonine-protein kinase [Vicinamibacterales bacterium]|nr:serine/threonine-protein kinase [Vicinamibacterales bacterium]